MCLWPPADSSPAAGADLVGGRPSCRYGRRATALHSGARNCGLGTGTWTSMACPGFRVPHNKRLPGMVGVPASRSLAGFRSPVRSAESPLPASSTLRGKQSPIYGDVEPPVNGSVARQCRKTLAIDGLPSLALSCSRERMCDGSAARLSTPGRQIHRGRGGERGVRVAGQRTKGRKWWAMKDLNLRPQRCQRCALAN